MSSTFLLKSMLSLVSLRTLLEETSKIQQVNNNIYKDDYDLATNGML